MSKDAEVPKELEEMARKVLAYKAQADDGSREKRKKTTKIQRSRSSDNPVRDKESNEY